MRINIAYLKSFLDVVLDNDHPDFTIGHDDIRPLWEHDDHKLHMLIFHLELLEDENLIESSTHIPGIGFERVSNGQFTVTIKPLRLTAKGHQFASDLAKPGVIEQITDTFKNAGPGEVVNVVFALGRRVLEKKLDEIL